MNFITRWLHKRREAGYARWDQQRVGELSPALAKAIDDPFDYALRLSTGEIFRFETAERHGDFIHLTLLSSDFDGQRDNRAFPFERGIDVRLDDIVWVADAPYGS